MRRNTKDEYGFDPRMEMYSPPAEHGSADEVAAPAPEDAPLPPERLSTSVPEEGGETQGRRMLSARGVLKRAMLIPAASAIAIVSVTMASYNMDPLGGEGYYEEEYGYHGSEGSGKKTDPDETSDPSGRTDSFPKLKNLDPDFAGEYAWSDMGTEEFLILDGYFLVAGTVYTDGGTVISNPDGAVYDRDNNTLTLTDYHGSSLEANLMGNGFKVELVGDSELEYVKVWGAMYGGSITFTGSGSLTIKRSSPSGETDVGLMLEAEDSPSCVMVDREATVDIYGDYAVIIHRTTMEKAIYTLSPIETEGGECAPGEFVEITIVVRDTNGNVVYGDDGNPVMQVMTVKDIAKQQGMDLYDYSVVGEDGKPSPHVRFAPGE